MNIFVGSKVMSICNLNIMSKVQHLRYFLKVEDSIQAEPAIRSHNYFGFEVCSNYSTYIPKMIKIYGGRVPNVGISVLVWERMTLSKKLEVKIKYRTTPRQSWKNKQLLLHLKTTKWPLAVYVFAKKNGAKWFEETRL